MFRSRLRGKRGAYKLEDGKGEEIIQHETQICLGNWVCDSALQGGREAERTRFGWRMMRQFFDMVPERYPSRNT